jgi:thymidylate synthase (FAD)
LEYETNGIHETIKDLYQWAIDSGIAKEQARAVLPEGNTVSRLYVNGTLRSWIHYIELRSGNGTQLEHMEVARRVGEVITNIFPLAKNYIQE